MACGSGCCQPTPEPPEQASEIVGPIVQCDDTVSNKSKASTDKQSESCSEPQKEEDDCDAGCCKPREEEKPIVEHKSSNGNREEGAGNKSNKPVADEAPCTKGGCGIEEDAEEDIKGLQHDTVIQPKSIKACSTGCCAANSSTSVSSCEESCCDAEEETVQSLSNQNGCTANCCDGASKPQLVASCKDACCDSTLSKTVSPVATEIHTQQLDLEKGVSDREHVILSISGMTCTGCETKLRRTLGTHEAVKNLKTSLVLARAEFDLEVGRMSVEDAIKFLERTTEFKCERVSNRGSRLDFIVTGDATTYAKGPWPDGVTEISSYGKNVIRVEFDAKVIGARDLKERGWPTPMKLAPPRPDPSLDAGSKHVRHMGYMTILSALLTIPVLVMAWAPLPERDIAYGSASLALATIVQIVIAGPFYPKALKGLIFSRMIEMDLLIVLSTSAAYIFSVVSFGCLVAGRPLSTGEFFETSTLLVTLIMVGRYVAALARQKAVESISIRSLQTTTATLINGDETEIDARLLQYGDTFKILPESRIPTDGTVIDGESETNESMITGESRPVNKSIGSNVIAGSINGSGTLTVRLTRLPGDNTISTIAGMVDEAKLSKPKIQDIADKVASYFVPGVVTLTIITFTVWIAIGVAVRGQSGNQAAVHAITYAITVLIVSCPCAIGLAVPMVIVIASGVAAERGVIFKSATSIELAHKATDIVFDKTGTLTEGELSVVSEQHFGIPETLATNQALLLGLIGSNKHPISLAIATHLRSKNISPLPITNIQTIPSKGLQGTHSTSLLRAGSSTWLNLPPSPSPPSSLPTTTLHFTLNLSPTPTLTYTLHTPLRPSASPTLSSLLSKNITPHLLSGDTPASVHAIASLLRIPASNIRASCTPAQKREYVRDLQSRHPHRVVLFCGDGTNDAPALAQAHVGIHVPCIAGADVARGAADVVLLSPGLEGVVTVVRVSRGAMRRVWFNFGWSFVYNVVAVVVGSGALVRARLEPAYAGLGEVVSVLPVVGVAVGMRWGGV